MRSVAIDALHALYNMHEGLDDDDEDCEMVGLNVIGAHLVDWTDPRKCYIPGNSLSLADEGPRKVVNGDVHLDLASDILGRMKSNASKEEKKVLAPLLGKVHVSPASSEDKIRTLYDEVCIAIEDKLVADATGRNALYKIHVSLGKIVNSLGQSEAKKSRLSGERGSATPEVDTTGVNEDEDEDRDEKTVMTVQQDDADDDGDEKTIGTIKQEESAMNEEDDVDDDRTVVVEATVLASRPKRTQPGNDSLVEELLSDEEDDL